MAIPVLGDIGKFFASLLGGGRAGAGAQAPVGTGAAAGTAAAGGASSFLNKMFQDKMFLSMLSGLGASLNPGAAKLNDMNQGLITSSNFVKMLGKFLGGEDPVPGQKATITADDKGVKTSMHYPIGPFHSTGGGQPSSGATGGGAAPAQPASGPQSSNVPAPAPSRTAVAGISPFASGQFDFSMSDLAGLTPEMISTALNFGLKKEEFEHQTVMDMIRASQGDRQMDITENYYTGLLKGQDETRAIQAAGTYLDYLTLLNKDDRTELQKNFAAAKADKDNPFPGSFTDFVTLANDTGNWSDYQKYVTQETEAGRTAMSYYKWLVDTSLARAGIDPFTKALKMADIDPRITLKDEPALQSLIKNSIGMREDIDTLLTKKLDQKGFAKIKAEITVGVIENLIVQGGGKIINAEPSEDGRTGTWTIQWPQPDGSVITETYTHALY